MKKITLTSKKKNHGFTLLEVMVAQVIFSVGLLGLAGLMTQSMSFNNSAKYRTQATFLAYDIFERMGNNQEEALTGTSYNIDWAARPNDDDCYNKNCAPSALAKADKTQWKDALDTLLPSGEGRITNPVAGNTRIFKIEIRWSDTASANGPSSYSLRAEI